SRHAQARHACLEALDEAGFTLPDTPPMALHRGRLDLLDASLLRDHDMLNRRFTLAEVYPPELGLGLDGGLTATPVDGVTLLHLAVEFDDLESVRWLLERGADPDARATTDSGGFGGHTPLFHAVVTLGARDGAAARLLLETGADPNARATI